MTNKKSNVNQSATKEYIDLLYMTSAEVSAREIAEIFNTIEDITAQLWEEMNVLELELANQHNVDFEPLSPSFKDPSDNAFVKNRNIKTIFLINLCKEDLDSLIPYFKMLIDRYAGFVCADSVDFTPVYAGSSLR